jgi:PilZ domain
MLEPFQLVRPARKALLTRGRRAVSERRHYFRHEGRPLRIEIEHQHYRTLDWSLGGCRIAAFHRPLTQGERLHGKLGPARGTKSGQFVAEVMHVSADGKIGLRWTEITSTSFFALSRFRAI